MKKGLRIALNIVLLVVVVGLAYKVYDSIMAPIRFQENYKKRSKVVIEKLEKLRDAEIAYLDVYQTYTSDYDTLINFIKYDSLRIIKSFGVVPDSIYLTSKNRREAEKRAMDLGIISRDTVKISVKDSLFKNYDVDTLPFVPYTNLETKFQLNVDSIKTVSKAVRPVFELKVHNNTFAKGLNEQLLINLNDKARDNNEFPGFVVGSLVEVTTAGNWD